MSLPAATRMLLDGDDDAEHVAGPDRAVVDEALLAVHDPGVVDARARDRMITWWPACSVDTMANVGGAITSG